MPELTISEIRHARTSDGVALAYRSIGDGPRTLLWSFSQLSDVEAIWSYAPIRDFLFDLAGSCRVIVHDRRGMGRSGGQFGDLETDVGDTVALLDAIGADRVYLAGAVFGGAIYATLAATHPERVVGLAWHGALARMLAAPDYPWGASAEELAADASELREAWGTRPFAARFVAYGAPSMAGDAESIEFFARWMQATYDPATAVAYSASWDGLDLRPMLARITVPTLVTIRDFDPGEPAYVASLIPSATFEALDGSDFMPFIRPADMAARLRDFITAR